MLIYLNMVLLLLATLYCFHVIKQQRQRIAEMNGMLAAMAVGMIFSSALGLNVAVTNYDLTISTIIAVSVGMIGGFALGRPISLIAAVDGMIAGSMGGMMGAMLGVMLLKPMLLVWFFDLVMLITVIMAVRIINQSAAKHHQSNETAESFYKKARGY